jgi:hypothetical protein
VFFAACDADMRGRTFYADFEPQPPFRQMGRSAGPVMDLGPAGAFDSDGVNPSQAFVTDGRLALLYIGWRRGAAAAPYALFAGVAFSNDEGQTFERGTTPLLAPRPGERLFRTAPLIERRADGYQLLYIGGDAFVISENGKALPIYSLMRLQSRDLWRWEGEPERLLAPDRAAGEIGFGRPVIDVSGGTRRLMLSVRTTAGYRLMETDAEFEPGCRPAMTNVIPDPLEPWEEQMTCFGATCRVGAFELLFYNGNGFGRTGAGLAWRPAAASLSPHPDPVEGRGEPTTR